MSLNSKPLVTVTQEEFNEWYDLKLKLESLKERESELRKKIFSAYFTEAHEGTNKLELQGGYTLNGKRVINRTIDKGAMVSLTPELQAAGIRLDDIVEWKPSLKLSVYRKLSEEQTKLFDQILVIKDGMPGLEIVAPKEVEYD